MTQPVVKASFRLATSDDKHLDTYDNTKLVAINTCPTWGILRYQMHKAMSGAGRAMALECGTAMHEVFAWVRLCTLAQSAPLALCDYHGNRLFGKERWPEITRQAEIAGDDTLTYAKAGSIAVLETGPFYDDPKDTRRTLNNMIEAALVYVDKWRWDRRVWVRDINDPQSDVGIEIPFDLVVMLTADDHGGLATFRLTGKIDGIHWHGDTLVVEDNKTAARLNEAWSQSLVMASQFTGYCAAASTFTGTEITDCAIHGISIPLPRSYDYGGIISEKVRRQPYHFEHWLRWLLHTVGMTEQYRDNPFDAPRYTHSCNRYFRPCSFIPFCDATDEDQRGIVEEMVNDEWSPLTEHVEG